MTKILLVEDDKSLREIYSVRLLAEGYTLISSGDGEEALTAAISEKPDLIVSDVMMPKISGFEMLDLLRSNESTKNIPVIMLTALSSEQQRERSDRLGANRYLIKSQVGIEDIVRAVHEVLHDGAKPAAAPQPTIATMPSQIQTPTPTAAAQQQAQPQTTPPAQTQMPAQPITPPTPTQPVNNLASITMQPANLQQPSTQATLSETVSAQPAAPSPLQQRPSYASATNTTTPPSQTTDSKSKVENANSAATSSVLSSADPISQQHNPASLPLPTAPQLSQTEEPKTEDTLPMPPAIENISATPESTAAMNDGAHLAPLPPTENPFTVVNANNNSASLPNGMQSPFNPQAATAPSQVVNPTTPVELPDTPMNIPSVSADNTQHPSAALDIDSILAQSAPDGASANPNLFPSS